MHGRHKGDIELQARMGHSPTQLARMGMQANSPVNLSPTRSVASVEGYTRSRVPSLTVAGLVGRMRRSGVEESERFCGSSPCRNSDEEASGPPEWTFKVEEASAGWVDGSARETPRMAEGGATCGGRSRALSPGSPDYPSSACDILGPRDIPSTSVEGYTGGGGVDMMAALPEVSGVGELSPGCPPPPAYLMREASHSISRHEHFAYI